jgi:exodeoxyribonuclease VII small subunit
MAQTPVTNSDGKNPNGKNLTSENPEPTFEEAFARLEEILHSLETGDLPLEESLSLYELGATLAAYCARKLDEAELRVRQWQPGHQTVPFDHGQDS